MEQKTQQYSNNESKAKSQLELIQTEEKINYLDRQIEQDNRKIKQIEQSNTWKMTAIFRRIKDFFVRLFRNDDKQTIQQLKAKLLERENEINRLKEESVEKQLLDEQITETEIIGRASCREKVKIKEARRNV